MLMSVLIYLQVIAYAETPLQICTYLLPFNFYSAHYFKLWLASQLYLCHVEIKIPLTCTTTTANLMILTGALSLQ